MSAHLLLESGLLRSEHIVRPTANEHSERTVGKGAGVVPTCGFADMVCRSAVLRGHRQTPMPAYGLYPPDLDLRLPCRRDHAFVGGDELRAFALGQRQIEAVVDRMAELDRKRERADVKLFNRNE